MSDSASRIAAICADRANTRLALATDLVARNAECEALRCQLGDMQHEVSVARRERADAQDEAKALRAEVSVLRAELSALRSQPVPPTRRVIARHDAERAARMARNRALTAAYFEAYPAERSVTPYQLEQFAAH
jgi:septal ring factor EnvC (AmiA/AmiB activator)